jgi:hypothetical protein
MFFVYPTPFINKNPSSIIPISGTKVSALIHGTRCTPSAIKANVQWSHNIYNELGGMVRVGQTKGDG